MDIDNDDDDDEIGICSSDNNECFLSSYGSDCNNLFIIEGSYLGHYGIEVFDIYGNGSGILASATAEEFYTIEFELFHGNNLISFSGIPSDPSLSSIFAPIQNYVTGLIGPGIASSHIGDGNWVGVITEINSITGYWLKIEYEDVNNDGFFNDLLLFQLNEAYPVDGNQTYHLQSGANLISFIGEDDALIIDTISEQKAKYFKSIIGEGVAASHQDLNGDGIPEYWVGNLETLNLQKGYWIILDLDECPTEGENSDCYPDNFGNAILDFNWE